MTIVSLDQGRIRIFIRAVDLYLGSIVLPIPNIKDTPHESGEIGQPTEALPYAKSGPRLSSATWSVSVNARHLKSSRVEWAALVDRGANGCIVGRDMKVIAKTKQARLLI
jgi:hypothetical protein